jgi:hypothetical protein
VVDGGDAWLAESKKKEEQGSGSRERGRVKRKNAKDCSYFSASFTILLT